MVKICLNVQILSVYWKKSGDKGNVMFRAKSRETTEAAPKEMSQFPPPPLSKKVMFVSAKKVGKTTFLETATKGEYPKAEVTSEAVVKTYLHDVIDAEMNLQLHLQDNPSKNIEYLSMNLKQVDYVVLCFDALDKMESVVNELQKLAAQVPEGKKIFFLGMKVADEARNKEIEKGLIAKGLTQELFFCDAKTNPASCRNVLNNLVIQIGHDIANQGKIANQAKKDPYQNLEKIKLALNVYLALRTDQTNEKKIKNRPTYTHYKKLGMCAFFSGFVHHGRKGVQRVNILLSSLNSLNSSDVDIKSFKEKFDRALKQSSGKVFSLRNIWKVAQDPKIIDENQLLEIIKLGQANFQNESTLSNTF